MNRWILAGSLGAVFLVTLGFSYGPGYGGSLLAFLGAKVSVSPKMSPSDTVTPVVTSKTLVTLKNVTNVTSVSPIMSPVVSPLIYGNSSYSSVSPVVSPVTSRSPTVSPTPSVSPRPSPTASVGTASHTSTPTPTATPTPPPPTSTPTSIPVINSAGSVVINEIAWMGTAFSANDEWIELYNTTDQTIDLTGWIMKSLTGVSLDPQITLTHSIQPFGFYLLERTDDTTVSDILADQVYAGALSDSGENIELRDTSGLLIDIVRGEGLWYAGNKDDRASMERINANKSGDNSTNWATNNKTTINGQDATTPGNPINGTPRSPNSVSTP